MESKTRLTLYATALGDNVLAIDLSEFGRVIWVKRDVENNKVVLVKVK